MTSTPESKRLYYDWHGPDIGTLAEIEPFIGGQATVLDLGCGSGWLAAKVASNSGRSVVGTDIDLTALQARITQPQPNTWFVCAGATRLPFSSAHFDFVIVKDVLEHLSGPAFAIKEIHRVLKPGGRVYVATPTPSSRTFWDDYTHIRPFTMKALHSLLVDHSFAIEDIYYTGNYPGVGKYMQMFGRERMPKLVRVLAQYGILRNNVHAIARKQ